MHESIVKNLIFIGETYLNLKKYDKSLQSS